MEALFEDVYLFTKSDGTHSYLVETPQGGLLIDPPPAEASQWEEIVALGGARFLLITHRDDIEGADFFREKGVALVMHPADAQSTALSVELPVEGGEELLPDLFVLAMPGHTPGSIGVLFSKGAGALFVGDALITTAKGRVALPPAIYSDDLKQAERTAEALLALAFDALCPAHGPVLLTGGHFALEQLVDELGGQQP
ncbi:MAG: MBL fold metallo-hydrolase [Firmicutes bacterium]|nr:MBL fold metallo-hydrolase [Bacillota bacterium]